MLENNLYHSKFDFYEKTKKSTKLKLCRMLYHYMLWRMKVKWYCQWNLYALVRYSNVVKVVGIAMPGVRSKRYALVDCTKFITNITYFACLNHPFKHLGVCHNLYLKNAISQNPPPIIHVIWKRTFREEISSVLESIRD